PFWGKVSSTRVPGCQRCIVVRRMPRGLTFSVKVISIGADSSGRESSAANLCGIRLSDRPLDRRVGTGAVMNPGDPRTGRMPQAPTESTYGIQHRVDLRPSIRVFAGLTIVGRAPTLWVARSEGCFLPALTSTLQFGSSAICPDRLLDSEIFAVIRWGGQQ